MRKKPSKYDPIEYDRHLYETKNVLRPLDERERWLTERYVQILRESSAVVFLHTSGLPTQDHKKVKASLLQRNIQLLHVNSRLFKGQLMGTRYRHLVPLLSGPTAVAWREDVRLVDPITGQEPPLHVDTISFTKDFYQAMAIPAAAKRLTVMGAKIEEHLFGPKELEMYAKLPVMKQVHGELLGLLGSPGQQLISLLGRHPGELSRVLQERQNQLQAQ